jgi:hypothetical protein
MLFEYVKKKWEDGVVSVGLPAAGYGDTPRIVSEGIPAIAIKLLSAEEKAKLVELAKEDAIARIDAGERPEIERAHLKSQLEEFAEFAEIGHALEIIAESDSRILSLEDVRRVWDRVSVAIDHNDADMLTGMASLEQALSEAGRFGKV